MQFARTPVGQVDVFLEMSSPDEVSQVWLLLSNSEAHDSNLGGFVVPDRTAVSAA